MDAATIARREGGVLFTLVARATGDEPAHAKWYRLSVQPGLFGGVDLVREWGALPPGPRPSVRRQHHRSMSGALRSLRAAAGERRRRGYQQRPVAR